MATNLPEEQKPDAKPPKKTKWYGSVLNVAACFWLFGGVNVLLFRDIPLLIFLGTAAVLFFLPVARWLGRPQNRWIKTAGGFAVLLGMAALVLFVIPPFFISPQTTYLTEPRSKEFYGIDYAAVIEKQLDPGVPAEENGFRLLTETFGRPFFGEKFADQHWNRLCQYLDLPTKIEPKLTFVSWQMYEKTLSPEEQEITGKLFCGNTTNLWSEEELAIVRRWLDENDAALNLFVAAADKQVLYVPPMFDGILMNTILTNDHICRKMARDLLVRLYYRLAIGETGKAWDDVLAIYRLGEQHRRGIWSSMSSMINNAIVGIANQSAESVMLHSDWTPEEIRRKVEEIVPFLRPLSGDEIKRILRNERFIALDGLAHMANGIYDFRVLSDTEQPAAPNFWERFQAKVAMRFLRMGIVMVDMNRRFDEIEQQYLNNEPVVREEREMFNWVDYLKTFAWYGQFGMIPVLVSPIMADLNTHVIDSWQTSPKTRHVNALLLRLQFALEAFKREHDGNYPGKLEDLPGIEIPLDPFSGKPFRYIIELPEDGKPDFLLYSVGPNGVDDEGRYYDDFPKGDDIRRRTSPDVVQNQPM